MATNKQRTAFIGNISYEGTEEELRELFSQVGPIANLRLVVDRDTGKRKGFGFVEYTDQETALSAVRNLNEIDFHGRPLRVNIAEQDAKSLPSAAASTLPPVNSKKRKEAEGHDALPEISVSLEPVDPLSKCIEAYDRTKLFAAVSGAKRFLRTRPNDAMQLLAQLPALVRGLHFAIDLMCGQHWPAADEQVEPATAEMLTSLQEASPADGGEGAAGDFSNGTEEGSAVNEQPTLGKLCMPGLGYIVPGPEHAPLLEQVLRLEPSDINALPDVQRCQLLEMQRQVREQLLAGNLAHLGITVSVDELPPPAYAVN
ncbi:hypothetical protein AB1Y20_021460 [Prymnesium parvum]|uniref:RRM domain-containing protein n=1 Tax=Prymnesium parvum TaxID=97485 RepID=A0AB34JLN8_PRYPA